MIFVLNEGGNSALKDMKYPLGKEIRKYLWNIYRNFKGDKHSDGYMRLCNLLSMDRNEGGINYQEMVQLKNVFEYINKNSDVYKTIGGRMMELWVNYALNGSVERLKSDKYARMRAGEENVFRKAHEKNRSIKSKEKPTQAKIQTKNVNQKMLNNKSIQYR